MTAGEGAEVAEARLHEAEERLTYDLLLGDEQAAEASRAVILSARDAIARERQGRMGPRIRARLDELAAARHDDPIAEALAGTRTYPELREDLRTGRLTQWLSSVEAELLGRHPDSLRYVLVARLTNTDPARLVESEVELRSRQGYALAARAQDRAEVGKVAEIIRTAMTTND